MICVCEWSSFLVCLTTDTLLTPPSLSPDRDTMMRAIILAAGLIAGTTAFGKCGGPLVKNGM